MKNIEKIGIDSMLEQFTVKNSELIQTMISTKSAAELAQQNFKKSAGPVVNLAKEIRASLVTDTVSEEALKYYEEKMIEILKMPITF
jgi:hypothetical protein